MNGIKLLPDPCFVSTYILAASLPCNLGHVSFSNIAMIKVADAQASVEAQSLVAAKEAEERVLESDTLEGIAGIAGNVALDAEQEGAPGSEEQVTLRFFSVLRLSSYLFHFPSLILPQRLFRQVATNVFQYDRMASLEDRLRALADVRIPACHV